MTRYIVTEERVFQNVVMIESEDWPDDYPGGEYEIIEESPDADSGLQKVVSIKETHRTQL